MTTIETAVGNAIVKLRGGGRQVQPKPANDASSPAPILPADLQDQVDRLSGRARYGDFVLTMPDGPMFHPDAARFAEQQRAATAPASEQMIRKWFMVVVNSLAPGPVGPEAVFGALLLTCGDLPAACWQRPTAAAIVGKHKFLPLASEIKEVLQPVADRLRGTLHALERIARADPATASSFHAGPAREAKGYVPPPTPPQREARVALHPTAEEIAAPVRTVEQQLAAFGLTPETATAALAEVRKRRGG